MTGKHGMAVLASARAVGIRPFLPARCRLRSVAKATTAIVAGWIAVKAWLQVEPDALFPHAFVTLRNRPGEMHRMSIPPHTARPQRLRGYDQPLIGTRGPLRERCSVSRSVFSGIMREVAEVVTERPNLFLGEVGVVILLSAIFGQAEKWARRQVLDQTGKLIIDGLVKEITILGFISLFLFLVTKSGAADSLAVQVMGARTWGSETENPLAETFEIIHIMIFLLLVVLLFQSLGVFFVTRQVIEKWGSYERARAFGMDQDSIESQLVADGYLKRVPNHEAPRGVDLHMGRPFKYGKDLYERLLLREDNLHKMIMYRAVRHEFIFPRRENRRSQARVRNPAVFSFEDYLCDRLSSIVVNLVEIDLPTWGITTAVLAPFLFSLAKLDPVQRQAAQCALAWFLVAFGVVFSILLEEDTWKFTPQLPEDGRQILRIFSNTSQQMLRRTSQARIWGFLDKKTSCPGLGGAKKLPKKLIPPPYFQKPDEHGKHGDDNKQVYISSRACQQSMRYIAFIQAICTTALILSFFSLSFSDPTLTALYLLTWAEWPVMFFLVIPWILRRLTIRQSIETKKDLKAIMRVSLDGNDGLIRDVLILVRLVGLARRASEGQVSQHAKKTVTKWGEQFSYLPEQKRSDLWNIFSMWDAGNTGQVNPSELSQTFVTMGYEEELAVKWSQNLLQLVDDDHTGNLTWRKAKALCMLAIFGSTDENLEEDIDDFFTLVDVDGNGQVSITEITQELKRMVRGLSEDDIANLFYKYFGRPVLQVSRRNFVEWGKSFAAESWKIESKQSTDPFGVLA